MNAYPVVDWRENVAKWIVDCIEDRGVPMFRMTELDGEVTVMGVCWGGLNRVGSVKFTNVPEEDKTIVRNSVGEWRIFLRKYGDEELKSKFKAALIVEDEDGNTKNVIKFTERDPWDLL